MKRVRSIAWLIVGVAALSGVVHYVFLRPAAELSRTFQNSPSVDPEQERVEVVKELAQALQKAEKDAAKKPINPTQPQAPKIIPPLSTEFIATIETPQIKSLLGREGEIDHEALREVLSQRLDNLPADHVPEGLRLLQVLQWSNQEKPDKSLDPFLVHLSQKYLFSEDPAVADYGRAALDYYLEQEPDPELRHQKRVQFIQQNGPAAAE